MAEFIKIHEANPSTRKIERVAEILRNGGLVIYPTDTVYGLGCDISNTKALERIAKIKGVKLAKANFSFICYNLSDLSAYIKQIDTATFKILKHNLPGPYTFILPGAKSLPKTFKKKKTVGIRIPDNNVALHIVKRLGNPIVSTSIYDDDKILEYTTNPEFILEKWNKHVDVVIDGGNGGNIPSTIIDLSDYPPKVLREGKGAVDII